MTSMNTQNWDTLIKNAMIFDGSGDEGRLGDIAIQAGKIAARGYDLDPKLADVIIDASGKWLMPGLLDVHTHYDLEVELAPGLSESVRHGTTTVVVANCSLGLAFGAQRENGQDPIVDCFARVENIPKPVLKRIADRVDWSTSDQYLAHLDTLKLGPNIVPMIPYSMLRIAAMGVTPSVTRAPTESELVHMEHLLDKGMREGYVGFSSDSLPFHYLSIDPHRENKIPSQYASFGELKRLTHVVRRWGRIWQATPPIESPLTVFRTFLLTSARLYGKALKITAVAALDVHANRSLVRSGFVLSWLLNSWIFKGHFVLQSLAARFKVWGDGATTPLSEEIPELRALAMCDLDDTEARRKVIDAPGFAERFVKMWMSGKTGFGLARLRRWLRIEHYAMRRDLAEMTIDKVSVKIWQGETFAAVFARLRKYQSGADVARGAEEKAAFDKFPKPVANDGAFMLHMLREYDRHLYWSTISANVNEASMRKLVMNPMFLPAFADSGAHLTNLAFYDANLRALKIAFEERGLAGVAFMVRRLTKHPAELFNIDAGSIAIGDQADIVLIDPCALAKHDGEASTQRIYRDVLQHDQLVNRSDGVVSQVFINGVSVWQEKHFTSVFETQKLGRVLLAKPQLEAA
jgi:N-acyl-D-aspartate/D-glutamate deacylase